MPLSTSLDLQGTTSNNIFSEFDMIYVCDENKFHVKEGPFFESTSNYFSAVPGTDEDLVDFTVWLIQYAPLLDGVSQEKAYLYYDTYYSNGIQTCSMPFDQTLIESGLVSQSFNDIDVVLSDIDIAGSEKNIEIYSTRTIALGNGFSIGNGATMQIGPGSCIY